MAVKGAHPTVDCYSHARSNTVALDTGRRASGEATSRKIQAGEKTESKEGIKDSGRAGASNTDTPLTQLHNGGATWLGKVYPTKAVE